MLSPTQADTAGTKRHGVLYLPRCIGVGANLHLGGFCTPIHDLSKVFVGLTALGRSLVFKETLDDLRRGSAYFARKNLTRSAVDREVIAFLEVQRADFHRPLGVVDLHIGSAANTDLTHLASNKCSVRADTTAGG